MSTESIGDRSVRKLHGDRYGARERRNLVLKQHLPRPEPRSPPVDPLEFLRVARTAAGQAAQLIARRLAGAPVELAEVRSRLAASATALARYEAAQGKVDDQESPS
jgi:hypothetical protein